MAWGGVGIPIGNLTSQIFANIYFNEFDYFVAHVLKPREYMRYGDDFIMVEADLDKLKSMRSSAISFLSDVLRLTINPKRDIILRPKNGLKFLGVEFWPNGRRLSKRNIRRLKERLNLKNASSYCGILDKHANEKTRKKFDWQLAQEVCSHFAP